MFGRISKEDRKDIVMAGIAIVIAVALYVFFRFVFALFLPFVLGAVLAILMRRPVWFLKRKLHVPVMIGTTLILVVVTILAGIFLHFVGNRVVSEGQKFLMNFPSYKEYFNRCVCNWCGNLDQTFHVQEGKMYAVVEQSMGKMAGNLTQKVLSVFMENSVSFVTTLFMAGGGIVITLTTLYYLIRDIDDTLMCLRYGKYANWYKVLLGNLIDFGGVYLKTQFVIMGITTVLCVIAMYLIRNPYPIMMGIIIGLLDALPLFGTGTILIPWTILLLFQRKIVYGAILFTAYCICYIVRECIEPKMMGNHMGIHPVIMLVSMYAGVLVFGVLGLVIGPIYYILMKSIMKYVEIHY